MPRYLNSDTDQFWDITLEGNVTRSTFGVKGKQGETSVKTWLDAAHAQAEYDKVIAFKEARGFALEGTAAKKPGKAAKAKPTGPQRNPKLEAVIGKDLDDVDAYRVYGDWLTEQGDIRGELIALATKKGHAKAAAALIDANREHLLGDLHEVSEQMMELDWRYGFVDAVRLEKVSGGADAEDRTVGALLAALLAHPSGAFLRTVRVGTADGVEDGMVEYGSIPEALGAAKAPHVTTIYIGDWEEWEVSWSGVDDASGFWKLPKLDTLTIRAGTMNLGKIESRTLRHLEIITGGLTKKNIKSLVTMKAPALETLRIYFGSKHYGASGGVSDLAPLLEGGKPFAKLRHLGLMNAEFTDELCTALGKAPIVKQLDKLDLSKGTMSRDGVAALVKHKKTFAHLDELVVSQNWLSSDDVKQLKGVAKSIVSKDQRSGDDRYVSLGE